MDKSTKDSIIIVGKIANKKITADKLANKLADRSINRLADRPVENVAEKILKIIKMQVSIAIIIATAT